MYKSVRIVRIVVSLLAMGVPTWALIAGYDSVFVRMQILTALLSGVAFVLIFWAAVTLIYGRIYCSTVCPMGTFMDCVGFVSRKVRRKSKSYSYLSPSNRTRSVFLLITLITLLSGISLVTTLLDPYSAYSRMVEELVMRPLGLMSTPLRFALASVGVAAATAMIVVSVAWKHGRFLCNTACPIGTILGYGSRRSYFHIEIDPDRCINCGECERVCKSSCIKLADKSVDTSRCVVCFDCTSVCPNASIQYKSGRYRLGMPMMQGLDVAAKNIKHPGSAQSPVQSTSKPEK